MQKSQHRKLLYYLITGISIFIFLFFAMQHDPITQSKKTYSEERSKGLKLWENVGFLADSFRTGDLILRTGKSFFSNELRKMCLRDQTYSHCGWISKDEKGKLRVYHSIGGTDNPDNSIRSDPIEQFCHPNEINRFAIYRYDLGLEQIMKGDSLAKTHYANRVQFDLGFDMQDVSELYCSEFIYNLLINITGDNNFIPLSIINDKNYIGIDDLFLNNHSTKIYEYEYN